MRDVPDRRDLDVDLVGELRSGERKFCGHDLPDGMKKNQRLREGDPHAVDQGGEGRPRRRSSRADELLAMGLLVGRGLRRAGADVRARCSRSARATPRERGLILVDTKYEIGRTPDGELVLHRRDPHAGFVALLVRRRLRGAAGARRRAARPRQGVRAALAAPTRATRGDGPPPAMLPTTCASRRRGATSRSASW